MLNKNEINNLSLTNDNSRCNLCENNCLLTIINLQDKEIITGNKCDKPLQKDGNNDIPNLFQYKYQQLFNYIPLTKQEATRGMIGIPRVLNIYEHYPFWFRFFTELKFQVIISPKSSKSVYEKGMETITSDTLCYPAKLVNGHILNLISMGVKTIFYPSVMFENVDYNTDNKFNCPVVISYPEVVEKNIDEIKEKNINYIHPFINFESLEKLTKSLYVLEKDFGISKKDIKNAAEKAWEELKIYKNNLKIKLEETLKIIEEKNINAIILSGRPYHVDPEINHGIDKIITDEGIAVLTEDSISLLDDSDLQLRVINQWAYHSRLYKAANYSTKHKNLELVQLNSFGCGIDSITSNQVKEILEHNNQLYTNIKIDEGSSLGAAKIRIRSLKASMKEREFKEIECNDKAYKYEKSEVVGDLSDYTIFAPQVSPIHFDFIQESAKAVGYDIRVLPAVDKTAIEKGLKYVDNDTCYPAIIVIGQMIGAIEKLDNRDKVALLITQTGGGCRATNYIALLRKALVDAGYHDIPVLSLSAGNVEDPNRIKVTYGFIKRLIMGMMYGDALMRMTYRLRPYEINKGETDNLHQIYKEKLLTNIKSGSFLEFKKLMKKMIRDFDKIEIDESIIKPKIGVVGEILVKYHPTANNEIVKVIEENNGEAVVPDLLDFFMYSVLSAEFTNKNIHGNKRYYIQKITASILDNLRNTMKKEFKKSKKFYNMHHINSTIKNAQEFLSMGNQTGEGWLLTGEIINLIKSGVTNIACVQPFGCLPNHIVGNGMFKAIRETYKEANIISIDYDPGASEVNQINRIKLMMTVAHRNLSK